MVTLVHAAAAVTSLATRRQVLVARWRRVSLLRFPCSAFFWLALSCTT